jgi:hypothetical protein
VPKGGHARVGPRIYDEATRDLHGTRERAKHRRKGNIGVPMITVAAPPHLTAPQRAIWSYYAGLLLAEGRLPMKARDTLAKYAVGLDMVAKLNRQIRSVLAGPGKAEKHPLLGELRSWLAITRLYENDLLLNPAASARAPIPATPPDDGEDAELDDLLN